MPSGKARIDPARGVASAAGGKLFVLADYQESGSIEAFHHLPTDRSVKGGVEVGEDQVAAETVQHLPLRRVGGEMPDVGGGTGKP